MKSVTSQAFRKASSNKVTYVWVKIRQDSTLIKYETFTTAFIWAADCNNWVLLCIVSQQYMRCDTCSDWGVNSPEDGWWCLDLDKLDRGLHTSCLLSVETDSVKVMFGTNVS